MKRSCLDLFKLRVKEARKQYDILCKLNTSFLDNGEFDLRLHHLFNEIRAGSTEARRLEGEQDVDNSVPAFDKWENVYTKCIRLQQEFFLHPKLNWARRKGILVFIRQNLLGIIIGVVSSLIAALLWTLANNQ